MPEPGPGQVRIRTACCGICATDLEMIKGWSRTGYPGIPGHEWSGVVDAVGDGVERSLMGRPCVADNVLADGGEVGFEHPGGYGEYFLTERANLRFLPADFPLQAAALIEPLAACVRGMKRLRLQDEHAVLVIGDGPIGLLMVTLFKAQNQPDIVCAGGRTARLALAHALGATRTVNYHATMNGAVQAASPFPLVIEASGSATGMQTALGCAAQGGKILVMGDYGTHRADFPWNLLLHRELELIGSNASAGAWDEAVQLAVNGTIPLERLISARFPVSACEAALHMARTSREAVKVVMEWPN